MGNLEYWESMNSYQYIALAMVAKLAGLCSFSMSLLVAVTIIRLRRRRAYHRIFLGISLTDLISSPIYIASTWMTPKHDILLEYYADEAPGLVNLPWNIGTHATCQAQAFLAQFSCATCCYTVSLLVYFYLVVMHRWKDSTIVRIERYLHSVPLLFGLTAATTGLLLGIYGVVPPVCYIAKRKSLYWIIFMYIPGWSFFLITIVTNFLIWRHVRGQEQKSQRFTFSQQTTTFQVEEAPNGGGLPSNETRIRRRGSITSMASPVVNGQGKEVAMQCLWFGLASSVHFSGLLIQSAQWLFTGRITFSTSLVAFATIPLYGLPSGCVFFRPKFITLRKRNPDKNLWRIIVETISPLQIDGDTREKSADGLPRRIATTVGPRDVADNMSETEVDNSDCLQQAVDNINLSSHFEPEGNRTSEVTKRGCHFDDDLQQCSS